MVHLHVLGDGCFRIDEFNVFTIWWLVKSYSDGTVAKGYRFRVLAVPGDGPILRGSEILVTTFISLGRW